MTDVRPATGIQYEIRRGGAVARVGQVAAVLREFSVDGVHFTETWDDAWVPPMGCGMVLVPWPTGSPGRPGPSGQSAEARHHRRSPPATPSTACCAIPLTPSWTSGPMR